MVYRTNPGSSTLTKNPAIHFDPSRITKICWALLRYRDKLISDILPVDSYMWTQVCWMTSKNSNSSALCEHRMQYR